MAPAARVHRVAPAADPAEAAARLYQALYGCTMHPAGLLHALAACLEAEARTGIKQQQVSRWWGTLLLEGAMV